MRYLILTSLLLAACSPEAPEIPAGRALYAGEGSDRLCLAGDRAGLITYGKGDANCSVRGRAERAGAQLVAIVPDGDPDCRIEAREADGSIRLGKAEASCTFYCGPGADFAGKAFTKSATASPAIDFAGDPLC